MMTVFLMFAAQCIYQVESIKEKNVEPFVGAFLNLMYCLTWIAILQYGWSISGKPELQADDQTKEEE